MRIRVFPLLAVVAGLTLLAACGDGGETPSASDPVDTFVQLDRSIEYGPMTINVKGAHISSSQVSVYYDVLTEAGVSADPVGPVAKLVYADGQEVLGTATAEFGETLPDGSLKSQPVDPLANAAHAVTFPLVRGSEEPFTIEFGRFMVGVPDPREYAVSTDGTVAIAELEGDTFELSAASDEDGSVAVRVQRVAGADPGGFLVNSVNDATLRDDLGNEYHFLHGETGFRKTELMKPIADRNVMVFAGPLNPKARVLYLAVLDSARVVGPVSGGQFSLP